MIRVLVLASALAAGQAAAAPVTLAQDTEILLETTSLLSSQSNRRGDAVALRTVDDVTVSGVVVIPKGTPATGQVTRAESKSGFGAAGTLAFELLFLKIDGRPIRLRGGTEARGHGNSTKAAFSNVLATAAAVAITGRRAEIGVGTRVTAYILRPVAID